MKTTATFNQPNREHHLAARHLLEMCLLSACLFLAWTGVKQTANVYHLQNRATVSVIEKSAPYDLAHDSNYRAMVLLYTAQNRTHDLPF